MNYKMLYDRSISLHVTSRLINEELLDVEIVRFVADGRRFPNPARIERDALRRAIDATRIVETGDGTYRVTLAGVEFLRES